MRCRTIALPMLGPVRLSGQQCGPGDVYLVGTGPGDPSLLTLRAVQLMQSADVVLYDRQVASLEAFASGSGHQLHDDADDGCSCRRLVSDDILRLVHGGARMVYVGKQAGYHTATQAEIHAMLCQFAEEGSTVVRLKGGDPFIFGRGGEEMQYLEERGITVHTIPGAALTAGYRACDWSVVRHVLCMSYRYASHSALLSSLSFALSSLMDFAGITAGAGICAELGIPMTHRGVATSVRFLTGHARASGEADLDEAVAAAADPHTTLIVYMGLKMLPTLTAQLRGATTLLYMRHAAGWYVHESSVASSGCMAS